MFALAVDRKHNVLLGQFSGIFSSDDIAESDAAFMAFNAREGSAHVIVDFNRLEAWAVPASKLAQRARHPVFSPGFRRVYVIQRPDFQAALRTFVVGQENAGIDPMLIVPTYEEALAVLDIVDPDFQPVEQ
jgi:hypothetical protein